MPLLIHSMSELWPVIRPLLELAGARAIIEVGGEAGGATALLLDYARSHSGTLSTVDPAPQDSLRRLFQHDRTHTGNLVEKRSLAALPELELADAYLIDGDHNYYTVLHELAIIFGRHQEAHTHPLVILHDVGWPWARRDLYYNPETIPVEWRHPYCYELGVTLDQPALVEGGFRGCGAWAPAVHEGGPRNGVRTAVEDFLSVAGEELVFQVVPAVFGLGVLYSPYAAWAQAATHFLEPYHDNPLLALLERNRLENYLRVIALQDELARMRNPERL